MFLGIDHPVPAVSAGILGYVLDSVDEQVSGPPDATEVGGEFGGRHQENLWTVGHRGQAPAIGDREHVEARGVVLAGQCAATDRHR